MAIPQEVIDAAEENPYVIIGNRIYEAEELYKLFDVRQIPYEEIPEV